MILQPGAPGNGFLGTDGAAAAADPCTAQPGLSNGSAANQPAHSNGCTASGHLRHQPNGILHVPQGPQTMQAWQAQQQQQHQWPTSEQAAAAAAAACKQQLQLQLQQQQQQLCLQQENLQQQAPVQMQLGAQMAQLHAQHNYSRQQPAGQQSNGQPGLTAWAQAQPHMMAVQQHNKEQGDSQQMQQQQQQFWPQQQQQQQQQRLFHQQHQQNQQQQYLEQQNHHHQQQQQQQQQTLQTGGMQKAKSALRQSLFALQQQQQHAAASQPQHTQQQLQPQTMPLSEQHTAPAGCTATYAQQQPNAGQHSQGPRQTAFVPAAAAGTSNHQQQQQQQEASGSAAGSKASPEGPPSSNLTSRLTIQLVATYKKCSREGGDGGVPQPLPRRILTRPAAGVKNNGWDNEACDLVLSTQVGLGGRPGCNITCRNITCRPCGQFTSTAGFATAHSSSGQQPLGCIANPGAYMQVYKAVYPSGSACIPSSPYSLLFMPPWHTSLKR